MVNLRTKKRSDVVVESSKATVAAMVHESTTPARRSRRSFPTPGPQARRDTCLPPPDFPISVDERPLAVPLLLRTIRIHPRFLLHQSPRVRKVERPVTDTPCQDPELAMAGRCAEAACRGERYHQRGAFNLRKAICRRGYNGVGRRAVAAGAIGLVSPLRGNDAPVCYRLSVEFT